MENVIGCSQCDEIPEKNCLECQEKFSEIVCDRDSCCMCGKIRPKGDPKVITCIKGSLFQELIALEGEWENGDQRFERAVRMYINIQKILKRGGTLIIRSEGLEVIEKGVNLVEREGLVAIGEELYRGLEREAKALESTPDELARTLVDIGLNVKTY